MPGDKNHGNGNDDNNHSTPWAWKRHFSQVPCASMELTHRLVCDNPGLCGDIPAGVSPDVYSSYCPRATQGTQLGSPCPSLAPTASPTSSPTTVSPTVSPNTVTPTGSPTGYASNPTGISDEQPLKQNWFRKRDVARKQAYPQKNAWFRKQAKRKGASINSE